MSAREQIEAALDDNAQQTRRALEFHWQLFKHSALDGLPAHDLVDRRLAFMAGAESCFVFIARAILERDQEQLMSRLLALSSECRRVQAELTLRYGGR